jgi:hypothetical protein
VDIGGFNLTAVNSSQTQDIIYIADQPIPKVHGSTINKTATTNICRAIHIDSTGTTVDASEVYENTIYSKSLTGQAILVGNDTTGSGDDKHDGAKIYGNKIYGALYYDRTLSSTGGHAIEFAWSKQALIYNNYINGAAYCIALKGGGHDWAGVGGAYFNVCEDIGGTGTNPSQGSIFVKGAQNVPVYNNTATLKEGYKTQYGLIRVYTNNDAGTYLDASAILKNNILEADSTQNLVYVGTAGNASDDASITADYNFYYARGGEFTASVGSATTYSTWADWQTAGYDANSQTPADPGFVSAAGGNFRLRSTSTAINAGDGTIYTSSTYSFDGVDVYGRNAVNVGAYQKNRYPGGGGLLLGMVGSAFYYKQAADE